MVVIVFLILPPFVLGRMGKLGKSKVLRTESYIFHYVSFVLKGLFLISLLLKHMLICECR